MKYIVCNEVKNALTTKDMEEHKLYYMQLGSLASIGTIIYIKEERKIFCFGLSSKYYTIRNPSDVLYDQIKEIKRLVVEV